MIRASFLIPGDLALPTGGYAYARRILPRLSAHTVSVRHLALPGGFPFPDEAALAATKAALAAIPAREVALIDGLAYGALPESLIAHVAAPIVALVHHPLGLETGLSQEDSARLIEMERRALSFARRVVATSETTADTLRREFGVPAERLSVAVPGTEQAERAMGGGRLTHLVSVGALVPRKGFDVLVEALARLTDRPWRCTIAGSTDRDPATAQSLRAQIAGAGLAERVTLTGALEASALDALYDRADIFVLPSRYEGYGMAFTEAMARGLPIVAAAAGAVPATVPPAAGLLVPPDDAPALAEALRALLEDGGLRQRLSDGAYAHAQSLPGWDDTAKRVADAIHQASEGQ